MRDESRKVMEWTQQELAIENAVVAGLELIEMATQGLPRNDGEWAKPYRRNLDSVTSLLLRTKRFRDKHKEMHDTARERFALWDTLLKSPTPDNGRGCTEIQAKWIYIDGRMREHAREVVAVEHARVMDATHPPSPTSDTIPPPPLTSDAIPPPAPTGDATET